MQSVVDAGAVLTQGLRKHYCPESCRTFPSGWVLRFTE